MKIVFYGANAETFRPGVEAALGADHQILQVSDAVATTEELDALTTADVVIGVHYRAGAPALTCKMFLLPSAGYDAVNMDALPEGCLVANCFGHENAIAEYVMCALLMRHVPLAEADSQLRQGDWTYWAGKPTGLRTELGAQSIGIIGHGHIGKAVAARAMAFGMSVHVANRSPLGGTDYAGTYGLDDLPAMLGQVDIVINTLPLAPETEGMIGADAFAAMQPHAIIMNVGRGAVIDEEAMYTALRDNRIGGAIIDTWYVYPGADAPNPHPSRFPFHELANVVITPHMSGWTHGTIARRCATLVDNIRRYVDGQPLVNRLR